MRDRIKIEINNEVIDLNEIDGTESAAFTYRKKDDAGETAFSFSPELVLRGRAKEIIEEQILCKPFPALESVEVIVTDKCCSDEFGDPLLLFTGLIEGADVQQSLFPECFVTISIIDNTADANAIRCLKNIFPWDRLDKANGTGISLGEDTFRQSPQLEYCAVWRPIFLFEAVLIFGWIFLLIFIPIIFIVAAIATVINAIIAAINFFGGNITPIDFDGNDDTSLFADAANLVQDLATLIVSCGYKHKAPFIHSYLQNICDICGLTLSSSIFGPGGYYFNTMRLDASRVNGGRKLQKILSAYEDNKPNINGIAFLDTFNEFNIRWRVVGGALIIERKDTEFGGLWFALTTLQDEQIISFSIDVEDEKPKAFGEYLYAEDGVDKAADEVVNDWTDRVIDWNTPPRIEQAGLKQVKFNFAACLFRNDSNRDRVSPLDKTLYNVAYPILAQTNNVALIDKGVTAFPKLLIWDGTSDFDSARVIRFQGNGDAGTFDFNAPFYVKRGYTDGGNNSIDTLYEKLFVIDDPRVAGIRTRNFELRIRANCELKRAFDIDKYIFLPVCGDQKKAILEEVQYDSDKNEFSIKGKV